MAFKFVVFAAVLAYANAGLLAAPAIATYSAAPAVSSAYIHTAAPAIAVAPAAPALALSHAAPVVSTYAAAPVALHAPAVGASQQNVFRSLGGAQSVSTYSKAVDSAFSSVRKYDTRITNDGLAVAHAVSPYATYAAPALSAFSTPLITKTVAPIASPIVSAYSAPVVAKTIAAAPVAYSPAAVVAHTSFSGLGASYAW